MDASTAPDGRTHASHAAGIIAAPCAVDPATRSTASRHYSSTVNTWTTVNGARDVKRSTIEYRVMPEAGTTADKMALLNEEPFIINGAYPVPETMRGLFSRYEARYTAFQATHLSADLAGLVERIATGLSLSSWDATVTSLTLTGGADPRLHSLATMGTPSCSLIDAVFIPRNTPSLLNGDVFSVMTHAAVGCGATVVSDLFLLNARMEPTCSVVPAHEFPFAAIGALRVLANNMIAANEGPLFALALTRGLHRGVVVRATDRQGYATRHLLKAGRFSIPHGGISAEVPAVFTGLPHMRAADGTSVAAYVDGLALATAALVSVSDPGTVVDGTWFPTTVTTRATAFTEPGLSDAHGAANTASVWQAIVRVAPTFTDNYTLALARFFGCGDGVELAQRCFGLAASIAADLPFGSRAAVVSPWFWVEPTSLIPVGILEGPAAQNRNGPLATPGQLADFPLFDQFELDGPPDCDLTTARVRIDSSRRCGFLLHFGQTQAALDAVRVTQLDVARPVNVRAVEPAASVYTRLMRGDSISSYFTSEGLAIPTPRNWLNPGGAVGVELEHAARNGRFRDPTPLPDEFELEGSRVHISVGRPAGFTAVGAGGTPRRNNLADGVTISARAFMGRPQRGIPSRGVAFMGLAPSAAPRPFYDREVVNPDPPMQPRPPPTTSVVEGITNEQPPEVALGPRPTPATHLGTTSGPRAPAAALTGGGSGGRGQAPAPAQAGAPVIPAATGGGPTPSPQGPI